ncbi:MAG: hypothetical protein KA403_04770 [Candidatus Omnitrophica bacterium]|nr:hypothetical protein [Candidatus Omnitrophota bacterium]
MRVLTGLAAVVLIVTIGCTTTQKGSAIGGLGGAALGGIIGHQSDHGVAGAAIGGAAGAVGGMLVGEHMDKKFCPVCGRSFTSDVRFCSVDGTELKFRQ